MTLLVFVLLAFLLDTTPANSQPPVIRMIKGPDGQMIQVPGPGGVPMGSSPSPTKPNSGKPDAKSGDKNKEGDKKKGEEPPEPKIIRRGDQETADADPEELKVTVGPDGKVAFQFRNQPWVDLVQWLAQISEAPLDWQELPSDKVNLRSPGRYTVAQTKDLFNRHLLARGYTLLEMPGGITVAKTEGINPALVPRVSIEGLSNLTPHTFVRASLQLGWLSSEKMAEELKPMISSNGKLTALTTTNRIEAMDAAINLQQIAELLDQEINESSRDALAPEFRLRHISAEVAKSMLEEFLGVEKKKPMTPQQMQMMQQMQQRNGGKAPPQPKKAEISIVANTVQNSVLIRAPVDRIAIAREFINRIDVPSQSMMSLADIESRVEVFRLFSIDPDDLIEIVKEMNVLEPSTRIRADDSNGALIVSGSAADRFIVGKLVKRLDGSGRSFEVLQLRRLDATEVAESISFLMGKDEEKKESNSSRRYYFGYGGSNDDDKKEDEFRVAANSRFRQVLLWANENEMEQVRNLLIKLGELPPPGGSPKLVRRIEASSGPETYEYLLELQQQWEMISGKTLELPDPSNFVDPIAGAGDEETDGTESDGAAESGTASAADDEQAASAAIEDSAILLRQNSTTTNTNQGPSGGQAVQLTAMQNGANPTGTDIDDSGNVSDDVSDASSQIRSSKDFDRFFGDSQKATGGAADPGSSDAADSDGERGETPADRKSKDESPIRIKLDSEGNLVLMGSDTKALDELEMLMLQVSPPRRPYHVFKIKHQSAGYVRLNLVEYFEDTEDDGGSESDRFYGWLYGNISDEEDEGPSGLGKQGELRFVYDPDTNTIVVSGASPSQLKTISELIDLWDVAEPVNKRKMRYTKLVTVEFGRAEKIAETVKEAYRDLLSSNDKTFVAGGRGGGRGGGGGGDGSKEKSSDRDSKGSGLVDSENGQDGGDVDFSFKGKLSMGIDTVGNTLLVSAEGEPLLDLVVEMIKKLDLAAKPAGSMQIMQVSGDTSPASIERILKAFGGSGTSLSNGGGVGQENGDRNGDRRGKGRGGSENAGRP